MPVLVILLFFSVFWLSSCKPDSRVEEVEVDDIPVQTSLRRFEQDLYSIDKNNISGGINILQNKYPDFFDFYAFEIMTWDSSELSQNIGIFLTEKNHVELNDTIQQVFGDMEEEKEILDEGFRYFAHYFPGINTPKVVTMITEFLYPTATTDSVLAISLEMYLGGNYPVYYSLDLPSYKVRRMDKYHLPAQAMMAWFDQKFGDMPHKGRLLDRMIMEGKKMYFMDAMFPDMADSLKTGWTHREMEWLKDNEYQMWTYYISQKMLYSSDAITYAPLVNDAPFTAAPNIPPESAPRIGVYTGWKIVKEYMEKHREVTLLQLFADLDSDKILKASGYNP